MNPEITLAPVPFPNNSQTQEERDARLIREPELTPRSRMLDYSNSLLRRENSFLLERNVLGAFFLGPYLSSSDRLTNPQLESDNPSFLYRASKFLSENQISSILSVTCLTVLPSAVACVSSVTEDLAKYREDLCYSYFISSVGVALIFTAITFAAPAIQRYLNNGDEFLLRLRQYRDNLGNVNEINAPNNDGDQAPVSRAPAPVPALRVEAQDPAPVPVPTQAPAPAQALRVEAQNQATEDSIVSVQLVFFQNQTQAPAPAPVPVPVPASSFGDDAQDDRRFAGNRNDPIQFLLEIGQQGVRGSAQLLADISTFLSARPREHEVARGDQDTSAPTLFFIFNQVQPNQTSERPSVEISSMRVNSAQGSPRNP